MKLKEEISQAFMDMAEELEKECGDWQNLQDTEADKEFRERIMEEVEKLEQNKKEGQ